MSDERRRGKYSAGVRPGELPARSRLGLTRGFEPIGGRRDQPAPVARELTQLAVFTIGGELYALDITRIKEIINPLPITRVPRSPSFIEGVIELRRAILPVVDLRKRFDVEASPPGRATKYLIVSMQGTGGERWIVGLIVDKVLEVIRIPRDDVRPAPMQTMGDEHRYFSGVCRHLDRIVMIIDLDAILSSNERISLAGMGESPLLPEPTGRPPAAPESARER